MPGELSTSQPGAAPLQHAARFYSHFPSTRSSVRCSTGTGHCERSGQRVAWPVEPGGGGGCLPLAPDRALGKAEPRTTRPGSTPAPAQVSDPEE